MEKNEKYGQSREVPKVLTILLALDKDLTNIFCSSMNKFLPFRSLKTHYKMLELSCHGIIWFAGWLAFIWLANAPSLYQMQTNLYLGLIIDVILIAVIKAFVRRRRPEDNKRDMFAVVGPDIYSFPSGHASRCSFIVYFFTVLFPLPIFCYPPLLAWLTSVCLSRVLLRRHHLLDIFAGVFLGIFEGYLMGILWLEKSTSDSLLSWLSDEKHVGGDYHI